MTNSYTNLAVKRDTYKKLKIRKEVMLKQEAIKWVKDCEVKSCMANIPDVIDEHHIECASCKRFKNFFNITEDDLQ